MFVLINDNNLYQFMNPKSLSSKQVCWAQELFYYHFRIDYRQSKAKEAANTWFHYLQQSAEEEKTLQAEIVKILYRLQSLLVRVSGLLVNLSQLSPFHQIFICGTIVFPDLYQFWDFFWSDIARDSL